MARKSMLYWIGVLVISVLFFQSGRGVMIVQLSTNDLSTLTSLTPILPLVGIQILAVGIGFGNLYFDGSFFASTLIVIAEPVGMTISTLSAPYSVYLIGFGIPIALLIISLIAEYISFNYYQVD